jgi:hypothetical protein
MPTAKKRKTNGELPASALSMKRYPPLIDRNDPVAMARLHAAISALDPEVEAEVMRWTENLMDDTGWLP